ncbi:MAG: hypothetical protein J6X29_02820 [Clostridia bacterium]|nr:hypothetical protein [Clostridia bacterium]MBP5648917.1 hypothetical protein [Clostridia bacterium]
MFLTGRADHQVDDKGRIRIPAKFKTEIGANPFIALGIGGCLYIYPEGEAKQIYGQIFSSINPYTTDPRLMGMRKILGNGEFIQEDTHNRLLIPKYLLDAAKITKNIVSIGMIDHIELWAEEVWAEFDKGTDLNKCFGEN